MFFEPMHAVTNEEMLFKVLGTPNPAAIPAGTLVILECEEMENNPTNFQIVVADDSATRKWAFVSLHQITPA